MPLTYSQLNSFRPYLMDSLTQAEGNETTMPLTGSWFKRHFPEQLRKRTKIVNHANARRKILQRRNVARRSLWTETLSAFAGMLTHTRRGSSTTGSNRSSTAFVEIRRNFSITACSVNVDRRSISGRTKKNENGRLVASIASSAYLTKAPTGSVKA